MTQPKPREYFIQGVTLDGHAFRPSDWAERLAGAMSSFRPDGVRAGIGGFIGYSPLCVPRTINGVKGVIVNEAGASEKLPTTRTPVRFRGAWPSAREGRRRPCSGSDRS